MIFDSLFLKVLTEEANKIAEAARRNASWSDRIPNAIKVGTAEIIGQGKYSISIIVDTTPDEDWRSPNPNSAPMARAYEYGSGVHGKYGATYPIRPKDAPMLAFDWPNHDPDFPAGKKYIGYSNQGNFLFNYVDHPGVRPKPFLKPAIEQNKPSIKAKIVQTFKRGLLDSIKAEFHDIQT